VNEEALKEEDGKGTLFCDLGEQTMQFQQEENSD
jgi:hypothetical protein